MSHLTTVPWRHQQAAIDFALHKPGAYLALRMGEGKSLCAIALVDLRQCQRTLIVCPKSVVDVWPGEFAKHTDGTYYVVPLQGGSIAERAKKVRRSIEMADAMHRPLVLVVNYEAAWRAPMDEALLRAKLDCVIGDELHRIKAAGGRASWFMTTLGKRVPWRIGLSGTPMPHSPLDCYAQFRFLDSRIFGTSNARFKARYAIYGGFNMKQVVGFANQDELQRKFYSIAFRVEEDVLDLPDATHQMRYCEATPKTARVYRDLSEEFYAQVEAGEITVANALTKIIRLQQVTSGYIVTDDGETHEYGNEKAHLLSDILADIDVQEPIVVFARFHHDLDVIRAVLEQSGRSCAELSGRVNQYLSWKRGDATAIITQMQSGSVGIDFTRARYCLYYSVDHSLGNFQQSQCRILRPGQTRPVTYYYLAMRHTIDTRIYKALRKKESVIDAVLNRASADDDTERQLTLL